MPAEPPTSSTDPAAPGATSGRARWQDPPLLASSGRSVPATAGQWLLIATAVVLDASLIQPLLRAILNEGPRDAALVSFVVAAVATASMFVAGRLHAGARGSNDGRGRATCGVLVVAWLLVGATIAALRLVGAAAPTSTQSWGATSGGGDLAGHAIAAAAFLLLFAISGVLAFNDGTYRNDAHAAYLLTQRGMRDARSRLVQWESVLHRLTLEQLRRRADVQHVGVLADTERRRSEDLAREARAFARVEIARVKADPAVTGIASLNHPDHPDHPDAAARPSQARPDRR